jgi:twitching motility protein PilT
MAEIDRYLRFMTENSASDFHMSTGVRPMFRIHGKMAATGDGAAEFTADQIMSLMEEILPERNRDEFRRESDTDFAYSIPGLGRFRVNVFMDLNGPGAVFRHIPEDLMTMERLGLPPAIADLCMLSSGLVLVTGPTGSGKSTTLAAMVDHINQTRKDHIITIEDPIEFVHQNKRCLINHRAVRQHTESFKRALRAALREDPDIVLVGEMRDLETTQIAIEVAETGHLVLGTLHTRTAASTVDRIIDQFPAEQQAQIRTMLSTSLKGVISQTLLPRKDRKGRIGAFEILIVTPAVANNIRDGKTHQILTSIQTGGKLGMRALNDHLVELVRAGIVDPKEAYLKSVERQDLASRLQVAGFPVR